MEQGLKQVQEHYAQVAQTAQCPCCDDAPQGEAFELYAKEALAGLPKGALKASRGCGDPVAQAKLQPGERVLDLGSGGGIDAIIAARLVGDQGYVYGLDMTLDMVRLAQSNAAKAGAGNVEFLHGTIDDIPLPSDSLDVVISNCVINFCENKKAVLKEALRVLKPNGRLVVSDIVAFNPIPAGANEGLRKVTGCTNGITLADSYQEILHELGYANSSVVPKTVYTLDALQEKAKRKGREEALESAMPYGIDGITGSAIIIAIK